MANNAPRLCLVSYDIAHPKRLARVHQYLRRLAMPVQYSVFVALLSRKKQERLMRGLEERIEPTEDDVRLYALSERGEHVNLGRQLYPEGVALLDGVRDLLALGKRRQTRGGSSRLWAPR